MPKLRVLYLLCLLSPVAFLLGYIAGVPKSASVPDYRYETVVPRKAATYPPHALVDENLRLAPNSQFAQSQFAVR
jgi:hypothetical protein